MDEVDGAEDDPNNAVDEAGCVAAPNNPLDDDCWAAADPTTPVDVEDWDCVPNNPLD